MKSLFGAFIIIISLLTTACISNTSHLQEGIASFRLQNYRKAFGQPEAVQAVKILGPAPPVQ